MSDTVKAVAMGIVGIGLATALFSPGRTTVSAIDSGSKGAQRILYTAESGRIG